MSAVSTKTPPAKRPRNFEPGVAMMCIKSASPAYKIGKTYTPYKSEKGWICMRGEDGLEDICSMLVSSFRKV